MKRKLVLMVSLFLFALCLFGTKTTFAESYKHANEFYLTGVEFANAEIVRTLPEPTRFSVWLTEVDNVFTNKRFRFDLDHNLYNTWVATLLTAQSANMNVRVGFIDGNIAEIVSIGLGTP